MSDFIIFKKAMQKHFEFLIENQDVLFLANIDKDSLWDLYLNSFPKGTNEIYRERREYDCSLCKHFIRSYGNIIAVKSNKLVSIWDFNVEYPFNKVCEKISSVIKGKEIKDIFVSKLNKLGTNKNRELGENNIVRTWEHFYLELPQRLVNKSHDTIESIQGNYRDVKNVFSRSMQELTLESGETVLELIEQGSLYRGEEFKETIKKFIKYKKEYINLIDKEKDNWCWFNCYNSVGKIRNTAIGTLLIDLSNNVDLNSAVLKWEKVIAPTNYKRPKAIFTKKMIEDAEKKINELGFTESLGRKYAVLEDIAVNNVLFVNRDAKPKLQGSVFDELKQDVAENIKKFDRVEEVSIESFVKDILPNINDIEILLENKHKNNFLSLIAPKNKSAPSMLKWGNNFSWSYVGNITDSMKQNVKNAGGNIDGVLRFSIQWNDGDNNQNDFDAHCREPNGNHIHYPNKGHIHPSSSMLDVDIITPGNKVAVENITWTDINKMQEGKYILFVNNYSHRGGRTGFTAEIEYDGQIYSYEYNKELRQNENVIVAEIEFNKKTGIKFIQSLDSSLSSKEIWGINTNKFHKVSVFMFSPNYWNSQEIGNKHYFFFINNCLNDSQPRGFYNEFLKEDLMKHKRVFEALGSKMKIEESNNQLSGLGFSSTKKDSIIVKVSGNFTRIIKIKF